MCIGIDADHGGCEVKVQVTAAPKAVGYEFISATDHTPHRG